MTAHQRVIHTDELFCQSFALMSYLDRDNGIMKENTPKISVGTKAERQCEKIIWLSVDIFIPFVTVRSELKVSHQ